MRCESRDVERGGRSQKKELLADNRCKVNIAHTTPEATISSSRTSIRRTGQEGKLSSDD